MAEIVRHEVLSVQAPPDLLAARQRTRALATELGFSLVDQTKIVTAASELARNMLEYGKGGEVRFEVLADGGKKGLRIAFCDKGPGIPDVQLALKDGFTTGTGTGMGLGLGGARRLMSEFEIHSAPGEGTTVIVTRWKQG